MFYAHGIEIIEASDCFCKNSVFLNDTYLHTVKMYINKLYTVIDLISAHFPISAQYDNV